MKLTLLKIEDRGAGLAAVFQTDRSSEGPLVCTAESLVIRIKNLEAISVDASVERDALAQIERMEKKQ